MAEAAEHEEEERHAEAQTAEKVAELAAEKAAEMAAEMAADARLARATMLISNPDGGMGHLGEEKHPPLLADGRHVFDGDADGGPVSISQGSSRLPMADVPTAKPPSADSARDQLLLAEEPVTLRLASCCQSPEIS